ncbi:MAG: hypothetical protein ACRECX_08240 [Methyloceanibacter sp.]|uniref:hypothetical protein n=1 Tax=Methyloceanibacter sp. TaxID=1965321 RepID=UPI003D6CF5A0
MHVDTDVFVVWAHRNARSLFGAASNPIMRNGVLLCFKTEELARIERDRLNAKSGGTHVHYSVRAVRVQIRVPSRPPTSQAPQLHYAGAAPDALGAASPRAA